MMSGVGRPTLGMKVAQEPRAFSGSLLVANLNARSVVSTRERAAIHLLRPGSYAALASASQEFSLLVTASGKASAPALTLHLQPRRWRQRGSANLRKKPEHSHPLEVSFLDPQCEARLGYCLCKVSLLATPLLSFHCLLPLPETCRPYKGRFWGREPTSCTPLSTSILW